MVEATRAEQAPTREVFKASPTLMLHIAHGEFDPTKTAGLDKTPTKIAQSSYDALKRNHDDIRKKQQEDTYQRIKDQIRQDPSIGEPSPEQLRHLHFTAWAKTEFFKITAMWSHSSSGQALQSAFAKLHIDINAPPITDQLYSEGNRQPGKFYTEFCTGNTNQKLVAALDEGDMIVLRDFLVDTLGSEVAYAALLATKQTQLAIDAHQTLQPGPAGLSDKDRVVLAFFQGKEPQQAAAEPLGPRKPEPLAAPPTIRVKLTEEPEVKPITPPTEESVAPAEAVPTSGSDIRDKVRGLATELQEHAQLDHEIAVLITGGKFLWQDVFYGPRLEKDDNNLYRGYLMIEPEDIPQAVRLLQQIGEEREKEESPKTTQFKWLLGIKTNPNGLRLLSDSEIGDYEEINPTDSRIVIYGDSSDEVQQILQALAENDNWQSIEEHRVATAGELAPLRPNTNALTINGREIRSLNYNPKPGHSEDNV